MTGPQSLYAPWLQLERNKWKEKRVLYHMQMTTGSKLLPVHQTNAYVGPCHPGTSCRLTAVSAEAPILKK